MTTQETIRLLKMEMLGDSEQMECAKQIAVEALEKQIPKKPIIDEEKFAICPSCKADVTDIYCGVCGQRIDWGGEG